MRNRLLFLSLAFVAYYLLVGDRTFDAIKLDPVKPALVPVPNPAYDLEEPGVTELFPGSAPHSGILSWLHQEAILISQPDPSPQDTLLRLQTKAADLAEGDLAVLKRSALNRHLESDERFLSVYLLGLAGGRGLDLLRELTMARIPGLPNDRQHSDEIILRTQAIETLVQKLPREESRALLQELLSRTSDPILARHVQYWLNRLS
jgi:hypothetical protein